MIKICIPYYSEWEQPKKGILETKKSGIPCIEQAAQGPYIAQARNALVNGESSQKVWQTIGKEFSHYLFVDSDVGFTPEHLKAILALNCDVACCPYLRHGSKTVYQVGTFSEPGLIKERFTNDRKGIQVVDWCGGGFLLVKASVFGRIPYPWFRYGILEKDGMAELISEDLCFSMALKAANINIWCNFDFPVYHRNRKVEYKT